MFCYADNCDSANAAETPAPDPGVRYQSPDLLPTANDSTSWRGFMDPGTAATLERSAATGDGAAVFADYSAGAAPGAAPWAFWLAAGFGLSYLLRAHS